MVGFSDPKVQICAPELEMGEMENLLDVRMKGANYGEEVFMPKSISNSAIFHIAFRTLNIHDPLI